MAPADPRGLRANASIAVTPARTGDREDLADDDRPTDDGTEDESRDDGKDQRIGALEETGQHPASPAPLPRRRSGNQSTQAQQKKKVNMLSDLINQKSAKTLGPATKLGSRMYPNRVALSEEVNTRVVEVMRERLAEAADLSSQAKFAHWNVKGYNFAQLHLVFDQVAKAIEGQIDPIAEPITELGGDSPRSDFLNQLIVDAEEQLYSSKLTLKLAALSEVTNPAE